MKVVIVGGVAGGASAAARLRRLDESAEIVVFERGAYVSYANCGMPYHVGEVIKERKALFVATPESLRTDYNLDVRVRQEVTGIDRGRKRVTVRKLESGETYEESYDKLILSPGAKPFVPKVPGVDLPGVFFLRSIPDMDAIKAFVDADKAHSVLVVGGGFIGLEMLENLAARGLEVTLVEMLDQVMTPLDFEMASLVHRHLRLKNVRMALGDGFKSIARDAQQHLAVTLASGRVALADLVIVAVGVQPETDLAKAAGLDLGPRGHIVVNAQMQTNDPDIYAIGDAVQIMDPISHKPTAVPLAGPANRQGRLAADHIVGKAVAYQGTQGTSIAKVFDLAVATTGLNAKQLKQQGIAFRSSITHSADHASYYPGSTQMAIKLLYAPDTGKLFGAQVVGVNGVARSINVLATALKAGMSVFDLENLELAYAPPFGAAKDPVNIAGFVAANWLRGDVELINWDDMAHLDVQKDVVLDVRTPTEWGVGHLEGVMHIPLQELRVRLGEVPHDKRIVVHCKIGKRGYVAARILRYHGFQAVNLSGGLDTLSAATEKQSNFDEWKPQGSLATDDTTVSAPPQMPALGNASLVELDACGLQCPGPIMQVYRQMQTLLPGQFLRVKATDMGFARDIGSWCQSTGNQLVEVKQEGGTIVAVLRKQDKTVASVAGSSLSVSSEPKERTLIMFSGDLDHALAGFILANGAVAAGEKVTMFFTFWGLNMLRKSQSPPIKKNLIERMFGWMMPKGPDKLVLSRLNMGGMGTLMMKQIMKSKGIDSLPELIRSAQQAGVRIIACQMTMDLMGIKAEELMDGVEIGGVATYTAASDTASVNLVV